MSQLPSLLNDILKRSDTIQKLNKDANKLTSTFTHDDLLTSCSLLASRYTRHMTDASLDDLSNDKQVVFDTCIIVRARFDEDLKDSMRQASLQALNFFTMNEFLAIDISDHFSVKDVECHLAFCNSTHLPPAIRFIHTLQAMIKNNDSHHDHFAIDLYAFYPVLPHPLGNVTDVLFEKIDNFTFTDFDSNPMAIFNRVSETFVHLDALNTQYHNESLIRSLCGMNPLTKKEASALIDT